MPSKDLPSTAPPEQPVIAKLSTLDRFLPLWIIGAMGLGLVLGKTVPHLNESLEALKIGQVSLPIAVGLLVMMYPVLAKVRYNQTSSVLTDKKLLITSLVINWLLAPAFMFTLAWVFCPTSRSTERGLSSLVWLAVLPWS